MQFAPVVTAGRYVNLAATFISCDLLPLSTGIFRSNVAPWKLSTRDALYSRTKHCSYGANLQIAASR
jgi:hypothetical protein